MRGIAGAVAVLSLVASIGGDSAAGELANRTAQPPAAPSWPVERLGRVSSTAGGAAGNGASASPSVSSDGRFVAFHSLAANLTTPATNGKQHVFVTDLSTGVTRLASAAGSGAQGNAASLRPSLSGDGKFVAFQSIASNLAGSAGGFNQILVKDLTTGGVARLSDGAGSASGNGASIAPALSANGLFVAFESKATNLHAQCNSAVSKILLRDRGRSAIQCVSTRANGQPANAASAAASISSTGRYVAFESEATNLDPACATGTSHIFVKDRTTGAVKCASTSVGAIAANKASTAAAISSTGGFVAFQSAATNLDPKCTNGRVHIFIKNRTTGSIRCASRNEAGIAANGGNAGAVISSDGEIVAFESAANNLVPGDRNAKVDLFVKNLSDGKVQRISKAQTSWLQPNNVSGAAAMTANGHYVAFDSAASNLTPPDANAASDVFVALNPAYRPKITRTVRLSVTGAASGAATAGAAVRATTRAQGNGYSGVEFIQISEDDQFVSFSTTASNIFSGPCNYAFDPEGPPLYFIRKELATGVMECTAHPHDALIPPWQASADGRYQVFESGSADLDPDCFRTQNIFVRDNLTGSVVCVSKNALGVHGNEDSTRPSISPDGTKVLFASQAQNLLGGASPGADYLYLKDMTTGALAFGGVDESGQPQPISTSGAHSYAHFSHDGKSILYVLGSGEPFIRNLAADVVKPLPGVTNIYLTEDWTRAVVDDGCVRVHDLVAGTSDCAAENAAGVPANNVSKITGSDDTEYPPSLGWINPVLSDDGRYVVFRSLANNLTPPDVNFSYDVFVKDMTSGAIARISVAPDGTDGLDNSYGPGISRDGRYVLFGSYASNLVAGDTQRCVDGGNCPDVFLTPNPLYQ